ncbi:MAG: ShlB/FhaC/HecB family hemolysin secretion/activation protein, partial [Rhodanobacter sp.]
RLDGPHAADFAWAQRYLDRYEGRCVGQQGIALMVRRVSDLIIDRGYVTTRVGVAGQDLSGGVLRLILVPGVIQHIRYADATPAGAWQSALTVRPGDLLNLRDIEQGLEQIKRVPSQDVNIDIAPGDAPGMSDLIITVKRRRPWHMVTTLDDTGSHATGRGQAGINAGFDNPLGLNDILSLGYNHDVWQSTGHGTRGVNANYSVPWGRWLFTLSAYDYAYHQTVAGYQTTFVSRGKSRTTDLAAQRVLHRTSAGKTTLEGRLGKRQAHSFIEDTEVVSQRRNVTTVELALRQRQYLGAVQLDLRLAQRRGVSWFGGQGNGLRQRPDEPTSRYRLWLFDTSLSVPFQLGGQPLQWDSELHAQRSGDTLYASEFISLGGRYTVRGFDGEQTLAAERGWSWRNTLTAPLGKWPAAIYAGIDLGHVGGPSKNNLATDHSLRGSVLGVRGNVGRLGWDVFAGWAWKGGRLLETRRPATGFQLIYAY